MVVGNQATPIPLTLDGQPHTISRPLEAIAASATAGTKYTLQLTGGTLLYGPVRGVAAITFTKVDLTLPTAGADAVSGGAGILATTRTCLSRRKFSIRGQGRAPAGDRGRQAREGPARDAPSSTCAASPRAPSRSR